MTVHAQTVSKTGVRAPLRQQPDEPLLVGLLCFSMVVRFFVPSQVLDLAEHYSSVGGSIVEKIHPGAILLCMVAGFAMLFGNYQPTPRNRTVSHASWIVIAALFAVSCLGMLTGRTQGFSYLLDSLLLGPVVCLIMIRLNDNDKQKIFLFLLGCFVLNALILFPEFATKRRLITYDYVEPTFRPTALLGHPLANGLICAVAIPFVWVTNWSATRKFFLTFVFVAACFIAQARMASIFSSLAALTCIWIFLGQSFRSRKIDEGTVVVSALVTLGLIVFAVAVIVLTGLAERLTENGLNDASSQSRLTIYGLFDYMTRQQFLFGMPRDWADYVMKNALKLPRSESSVVDFIVQFGLVGTLFLATAILYYLRLLAKVSNNAFVWVGVLVFTGLAATNNTISSKGPHLAIIAALTMGALGMRQAQRALPRRAPAPVRIDDKHRVRSVA